MKGIDVTYLVYVDIYTNPEPIKVWARAEIYENELELYSITNMEDVEMMECFNDWFIDLVRDDVVQQAFEDNLLEEEYPDKRYGEL
jgi:hypothetical protein